MVTKILDHFDIRQIANSGQCFRINKHSSKQNTYTVIAYGKYLEVIQVPESKEVKFNCTDKEFEEIWKKYFDLEANYGYYIDHVDTEDKFLTSAVAAGDGIRILRQELWETMVSFIISQNNNISRIKKSIEVLCEFCGKGQKAGDGTIYYLFPQAEDLLDIKLLQIAKLGYRDKYIQKLAENVVAGEINMEILNNPLLTDEYIENYLKGIYGIGTKVANCIMLFGLHKINSFPMDTWIKKIIRDEYNGVFPVDQYNGFVGIIQQYIFNYAMHRKEEG